MENYEKETIAAIATALSDSGIGIVRISGENAIYIVDSIFRSASGKKILTKVQSHMIHYGYIVDKDENIIDEVMTSVMKAPKSYTMEDTVEINCHGGVLVMQKVLETVLQAFFGQPVEGKTFGQDSQPAGRYFISDCFYRIGIG